MSLLGIDGRGGFGALKDGEDQLVEPVKVEQMCGAVCQDGQDGVHQRDSIPQCNQIHHKDVREVGTKYQPDSQIGQQSKRIIQQDDK